MFFLAWVKVLGFMTFDLGGYFLQNGIAGLIIEADFEQYRWESWPTTHNKRTPRDKVLYLVYIIQTFQNSEDPGGFIDLNLFNVTALPLVIHSWSPGHTFLDLLHCLNANDTTLLPFDLGHSFKSGSVVLQNTDLITE